MSIARRTPTWTARPSTPPSSASSTRCCDAIELRASDIHLEPFEHEFRIRYRIDGVLQDVPVPRFPDGPNPLRHLLHKLFDHLHVEHHRRPWDGNHVNGTLKDTLPFVAVFVAASWAFPMATAPMFVAVLLQFYVLEEWVHHSEHFCSFKARYFQYIKRHHLSPHSPIGSSVGYGLTSGAWDLVFDTRIPEKDRRALYAGMK